MKKFKEKWNICSNYQLVIILIVFAITGSLSLYVSTPILKALSIEKEILSIWLFWPLKILIIFPIYQILILIIGTIFGQFKFFWKFEKKFLKRIGFKNLNDK
tara:strand:- start:6352 stop:6657 length:306 start_codon:yes stop_codon:yes gene_type:complete